MGPLHTYSATVTWTGAGASGTSSYTAYSRNHEVAITGKPVLPGTADPAFRGEAGRFTPEELFVASVSQCHMLWFLHLAATAGVVVTGYTDHVGGTMRIEAAGTGQFTEVVLRPHVTLGAPTTADGTPVTDDVVRGLHGRAHEMCFIARSVNFPVRVDPFTLATPVPLQSPAPVH